MIDPTNSILSAMYACVNGQLTYEGKEYKAYSAPPKSAQYDFVAIGDVNVLDDSVDTWLGTECTVSFDVITKATAWIPANSIATQIMELVIDKEIIFQGFKLTVLPYLDSIAQFTEMKETETIYRKVIRVIFKLKENG